MSGFIFLILNFFFRPRVRKSNYFRTEKHIASTDHYFIYWKKATKGRIALLLYFILFCFSGGTVYQFYQNIPIIIADVDQGLPVMLPPKLEEQQDIRIKERNILIVSLGANDQLLVEDQPTDIKELKRIAKAFIDNRGTDPESSESPQKAVISLQTDLKTSYEFYIKARDILLLAYAELRAAHLGLSVAEYNEIAKNRDISANKILYNSAKAAYPQMISD